MKAAVIKATSKFDYVLAPTTPVVNYAAELIAPDPEDTIGFCGFTGLFNQTGQLLVLIRLENPTPQHYNSAWTVSARWFSPISPRKAARPARKAPWRPARRSADRKKCPSR